MRVDAKRVAILGFALWEAYWGYVFFSAPVPDERMNTVFALWMSVVPVVLATVVGLMILGVRLGRRR